MFRSKDVHLGSGRTRLGRRRFLALTAGALGFGAVAGAIEPDPYRRGAGDRASPGHPAPGAVPGQTSCRDARRRHALLRRDGAQPGRAVPIALASGRRRGRLRRTALRRALCRRCRRRAADASRTSCMLYDPSQAPPRDVRGQPLGKSVWAEAHRRSRRRSGARLSGHERQLPVLPRDQPHAERAVRVVLATVGWRDALRAARLRAIRRSGATPAPRCRSSRAPFWRAAAASSRCGRWVASSPSATVCSATLPFSRRRRPAAAHFW